MHSHDRTMLANLGFADPDKKDPKHDWACQYIAELAENGKLGSSLIGPILEGTSSLFDWEKNYCYKYYDILSVNTEVMLCKGEGQYRTTVGFLDVSVFFRYGAGPNSLCGVNFGERASRAIFEVKINDIPIGNIIRQINLYRQYFRSPDRPPVPAALWIVASAFPLPSIDVEALKREDIRHVFLGDSFVRWYEEKSKVVSRDTIEL